MWTRLNTIASQVAETVAPAINEAREALAEAADSDVDDVIPNDGDGVPTDVQEVKSSGWSLKTALNAVAPVMDELRDALRRTPVDDDDDGGEAEAEAEKKQGVDNQPRTPPLSNSDDDMHTPEPVESDGTQPSSPIPTTTTTNNNITTTIKSKSPTTRPSAFQAVDSPNKYPKTAFTPPVHRKSEVDGEQAKYFTPVRQSSDEEEVTTVLVPLPPAPSSSMTGSIINSSSPLINRVHDLESQLRNSIATTNDWKLKCDTLRQELDTSMAHSTAAMELAMSQLQHELAQEKQRADEAVELQRQAEELVKSKDSELASSSHEQGGKVKSAKAQVAKLKKELEDSKAVAAQRLQQVEALEVQRVEWEAGQKEKLAKESEALQQRITMLEAQLSNATTSTTPAVDDKKSLLQDELVQMRDELKKLNTTLNDEISKRTESEARATQIADTIAQLELQRNQESRSHKQAIDNLSQQLVVAHANTNQIELLQGELSMANEALAIEKDAISKLQSHLETQQRDNAALQSRIMEEKDQAQLETEYQLLRDKHAALEASYIKLQEEQANMATVEKQTTTECEILRNEINSLEMALSSETASVTVHVQTIQGLEAKLKERESQYQKTHDSMNAYVKDLRAEITRMEERHVADSQAMEHMRAELDVKINGMRELEGKLQLVEAEKDALARSHGNESAVVKTLEDQLLVAKDKVDTLQEEFNRVSMEHERVMSDLKSELDSVRTDVKEKTSTLDTTKVELDKVSSALSRTTAELDKLEAQHRSRVSGLRLEHEKEMKLMMDSLHNISKKEEDSRAEVKRLSEELEKAKDSSVSSSSMMNHHHSNSPRQSSLGGVGGADDLIEKNVVTDLCVAFVKRGTARGDLGRKEVIEMMARHLGWSMEIRRQVDESYQSTTTATGLKNLVSSVVPSTPSMKLKPLIESFGGEVAQASKMLEDKTFADAVADFLQSELGDGGKNNSGGAENSRVLLVTTPVPPAPPAPPSPPPVLQPTVQSVTEPSPSIDASISV